MDIDNMNIVCNCKIKGTDNESYVNITPLFYENAKDLSFFDSNIGVVRCYNLVFSMNNKLKNIGFLIFLIFILLNIIFIIYFCIKGIKPIITYLFDEMVKNGYLKKTDAKFFEERNKKKKSDSSEISNPKKKKIKNSKIKDKKIEITKSITLKEPKNTYKNKNKKSLKIEPNNKFNKKKTNKDNKKPTQNFDDNPNDFGIIKINLNNNIKNYTPNDSNQSLYNYTFEEAIKFDRRNIFRIAYIYLLSKQIIFRTFLQRSPLELFILKFTLFIFMLSCDLALNALFYFNDNISKKYHYAKNIFLLAFSSNITIIIYSTLLSYFLIILFSKLSNSSNAIRNIFREEEQKLIKNKKYKINDTTKKKIFSEIENILGNLRIKVFFMLFIQTILILFF